MDKEKNQENPKENLVEIPQVISKIKPEIKDLNPQVQDLNLIDKLFTFIIKSSETESENQDLSLNKFVELLKKECGNETKESNINLSQLVLNEIQKDEKPSSEDVMISFKKILDFSNFNSKESISKLICYLLENKCEKSKNLLILLKMLQCTFKYLLESSNQQKKNNLKNKKKFKDLTESLSKRSNEIPKTPLPSEHMREIMEIKNYNQIMIELYEKETQKLRLKLKSYKQAVNTQLDNLNIKLGLNPFPSNDSEKNGDLGELPFGMAQDSAWMSFNNPFEKGYSNSFGSFNYPQSQQNIRTPIENGILNGNCLTPSVVRNFNGHAQIQTPEMSFLLEITSIRTFFILKIYLHLKYQLNQLKNY